MQRPPNPFSLYDFLGYFIPGAIALYSLIYFFGHVHPEFTPVSVARQLFDFSHPENYLPFVVTSYVVGHLLSYVSSITVEKYGVIQYGYPSKYLLNVPVQRYFSRRLWRKKLEWDDTPRVICLILLAPIVLFDYLLGQKLAFNLRFVRPLDPILRNPALEMMRTMLANLAIVGSPNNADEDFFRYVYHYSVEHAPNHFPKMQNYVAIYGFERTITLIVVIYFWLSIWHAFFTSVKWSVSLLVTVAIGLIAYLFFMAFMKFYRRFSLEAIMAAIIVYKFPPTRLLSSE